jgi:hypothetical protein
LTVRGRRVTRIWQSRVPFANLGNWPWIRSGQGLYGRRFAMQTLSQHEIEAACQSFADYGYAIFRDVVSKHEIAELRSNILDEYAHQKRSGVLFGGGGGISGHLNCYPGKGARFAYDQIEQRGILDVLKAVYPRIIAEPKMNLGCNLNLPNSVPQHYHVDGSFLGDFIIVNTALVDTTIANGAIDVLPGTHKKFYKYWRFTLERTHRLSTRLPLNEGDVLLRSSNLWHRGMPNRTSSPRLMLAMTFGDPGVPTFEDPFDVDQGEISFHANWFRTTRLGRLRERTFVAAPITYSAYRFARSLVGNKGYATQ